MQFDSHQALENYLRKYPQATTLVVRDSPLTSLTLSGCLTRLVIDNLPELRCIPEELPAGLKLLWIRSCPQLIYPPVLPKTLTHLLLENCRAMRHLAEQTQVRLPALPDTMVYLRVHDCPGIATGTVQSRWPRRTI